MNASEQNELLIRLDERTNRIDQNLAEHLKSCQKFYATKSDVAYLQKGFWGVIAFTFTAVGGALIKIIGFSK